jgi:hypothetical protein
MAYGYRVPCAFDLGGEKSGRWRPSSSSSPLLLVECGRPAGKQVVQEVCRLNRCIDGRISTSFSSIADQVALCQDIGVACTSRRYHTSFPPFLACCRPALLRCGCIGKPCGTSEESIETTSNGAYLRLFSQDSLTATPSRHLAIFPTLCPRPMPPDTSDSPTAIDDGRFPHDPAPDGPGSEGRCY